LHLKQTQPRLGIGCRSHRRSVEAVQRDVAGRCLTLSQNSVVKSSECGEFMGIHGKSEMGEIETTAANICGSV
jgi:hypothetical protein